MQSVNGRILIVDNDENITALIKLNLSSEGFDVDVVMSAASIDTDRLVDYRLIIVDAMNQYYSGLNITHDIKNNDKTQNIPVIMCTEPGSDDDIIKAFDVGVDDFISKPFSLRELVARVKAVLRRHPMREPAAQQRPRSNELSVPGVNLTINVENQKVAVDGVTVPLTKTEFAILIQLFQNRNSYFTREEICKVVWNNDTTGNVRIVDTNISRLRKKLGETGKHIINRYGMGYAFVDKIG